MADYSAPVQDWEAVEQIPEPQGTLWDLHSPEARNLQRAKFAGAAVKAFAKVVGEDEIETMVSDLVCDLMHLADAIGVEWDEIHERGVKNYIAEAELGED